MPPVHVQHVLLLLQSCIPQGSHEHQPGPGARVLSPTLGLPGGCQEQHWGTCAVRLKLGAGHRTKPERMKPLQPAFFNKLLLGRLFCPRPWPGNLCHAESVCHLATGHFPISIWTLFPYQPLPDGRAGTGRCKFLQTGWKTATANLCAVPFLLPLRALREALCSDCFLPARPEQHK